MKDATTEVSRLLIGKLSERRWRSADLADALDLPRATVWRWCVGETLPGDVHRAALCRTLSIPRATLAEACAVDAAARATTPKEK